MKVSPYCLNNSQFVEKPNPKATQPKQTPQALKAIQNAQQANELAQEALNQLYFAGSGGDSAYLSNAKALAELASLQADGITLPGAAYLAKGANAAALKALEQAGQIESRNGQQLDQVA